MSEIASLLRTLHRIHRQRADLTDRLQRGPRQVRGAEHNVQRLADEVAAAKEALQKTKMASDAKELQLKEREARIEDVRGKLNACNSNREYQAFKEQIAADEQANSVLSDEILESFDKIEREEQHMAQLVAQYESAVADAAKIRERVAAEQADLETKLARVERELTETEVEMPADFKQEYLRLSRVHGEDALATIEGESCEGCNTTITPQMYDQLLCDKLIFCKSCGRLLYLPEKTSVTD